MEHHIELADICFERCSAPDMGQTEEHRLNIWRKMYVFLKGNT